ncbi:MAG TPA: class I SAM-dependent methyltransferase [Patescibacteria group bacterium]
MTWDNRIVAAYQASDEKPDKKYSIGPTVVGLADPEGKEVLDLGCGSGFFTRRLIWAGAKRVIGLDNCPEKIRKAKIQPLPRLEYRLGDMFTDELPSVDVVTAPFTLNYARNEDQLLLLLARLYASLRAGGRLVSAIDLPEGRDLIRFGARKTLLGPKQDGTLIQIELFNQGLHFCTLPLAAHYFAPATIERTLTQIGFINLTWHKPIISPEGFKAFKNAPDFWKDYPDHPELGYITAQKPPSKS